MNKFYIYRNLNPYEVLEVNPDDPIEAVKKKFRRLSILVHPDKNQDDAERAMSAFDAVKKVLIIDVQHLDSVAIEGRFLKKSSFRSKLSLRFVLKLRMRA